MSLDEIQLTNSKEQAVRRSTDHFGYDPRFRFVFLLIKINHHGLPQSGDSRFPASGALTGPKGPSFAADVVDAVIEFCSSGADREHDPSDGRARLPVHCHSVGHQRNACIRA